MSDIDSKKTPLIYVTGFGPFGEHEKNPSQIIAEKILSSNLASELDVEIRCDIFNVCYEDVDKKISCKWSKLNPDLVVHLGVSGFASGIVLEKQAFNDNYCLLDVNKCLPASNQCQKGGLTTLQTKLDLEKAKTKLESLSLSNINFTISNDPGRYLCGYVYYKSLEIDCTRSIFVHIPTTEKISPDSAKALNYILEAIKAVIKILYDQVKTQKDIQTICEKLQYEAFSS